MAIGKRGLGRRGFLKGAAAGAAGMVAPPVAAAAQAPASSGVALDPTRPDAYPRTAPAQTSWSTC